MLGRLADNLSSPDGSLHTMGIQERLFSFLSRSSCKKTGGNLMPSSGSWSCSPPTKLHWHQGAGCWLLNLIPRVGMDLDWSTWVAAGISRVAGCAEQSSLWSLVHSHSEEPKSRDLEYIAGIQHWQRSSLRHGGMAPPWPQVPDISLNRDLFWHLGICRRRRSLIRNKKSLFIGKGQRVCNLKLVWFLCVWSHTENQLEPLY